MHVVLWVIWGADAESGVHFTIRALLKKICSKNSFQMKMFGILLVWLKPAKNVVYSQFEAEKKESAVLSSILPLCGWNAAFDRSVRNENIRNFK